MCDLAWIAGRAENLVGHHLRALRDAGLAQLPREGKIIFYSLTAAGQRAARCAPRDRGHVMTPPVELPTLVNAPASPSRPPSGASRMRERDRLIRQAKALSWLSLGWMTVEGAVAITAARWPGLWRCWDSGWTRRSRGWPR